MQAPNTWQWKIEFPGDVSWDRIGDAYRQALQPHYQELWMSSARIIQDHLLRAWIDAAQDLAANAAAIQQRALADLFNANQKAAGIFAKDVTDVAFSTVTPH